MNKSRWPLDNSTCEIQTYSQSGAKRDIKSPTCSQFAPALASQRGLLPWRDGMVTWIVSLFRRKPVEPIWRVDREGNAYKPTRRVVLRVKAS